MSDRFSRLSSDLLAHTDFLEQDLLAGRSSEELNEWATYQRLVDGIVVALIASREKMLPGDFVLFEQLAQEHRELTDSLLDSHYTLAGLNSVSSLIDRTMRLSQLRAANTPTSAS